MRRWWGSIRPLRDLPGVNLESVDDFVAEIHEAGGVGEGGEGRAREGDEEAETAAIIDLVFERVFERKIRPVLEVEAELLPQGVRCVWVLLGQKR